jgi:hypothetical protein
MKASTVNEQEETIMDIAPVPFTLTKQNMYMTGLVPEEEKLWDTLEGDVVIPGIFEYGGATYQTTEIAADAFRGYHAMESVTIPEGVTSIGGYAFDRCTGIKEIRLPDSLTHLGAAAFGRCKELKEITIPEGVTKLNRGTFDNCWSLENVSLPVNLKYIGNYAFANCAVLKDLVLPDSVTAIGSGAFRYCQTLTGINLPENLTEIGEDAFKGCNSLTEITIPSGVREIKEGTFAYCTALASAVIPGSTIVENGAFLDCYNLEAVFTPSRETPEPDTGTPEPEAPAQEMEKTFGEKAFDAAEAIQQESARYDRMAALVGRIVQIAGQDMDSVFGQIGNLVDIGFTEGDLLDAGFAKEDIEVVMEDVQAQATDERFEALKDRLFAEGIDAIGDFLGGEYCGDMDGEAIDALMDDAYAQMPDDVLEEFYEAYHIPDKDKGMYIGD